MHFAYISQTLYEFIIYKKKNAKGKKNKKFEAPEHPVDKHFAVDFVRTN